MQLGKINTLTIKRFAPPGAYLIDLQENEILLPNKYLTPEMEEGTEVEVFVMKDSSERMVAVTETPHVLLGDFAFLNVVEVNPYGAFVDWGLDKDLFVPFAEQRQRLEIGDRYLFTLLYDFETDRLFGSMKVKKVLESCQDMSLEGQEVDLLIWDEGKLGRNVIVNNRYEGLIFRDHLNQLLESEQVCKGYVAKVREDGKLDIRLEVPNDSRYDAAEQKILDMLADNDGFLALTDKSDPEEVRAVLGLSKKTFKQAIGKLYKHRRIALEADGLRSLNNPRTT
ncbi:MAG: GntR family transcriptional regulator [Crocinitomicaceae bacterium]|jgi:predicted RNA-binding protein (virulence factor B family)|nr:GntR family transcriptional regulator [Crocinitomicaceae bacterium]